MLCADRPSWIGCEPMPHSGKIFAINVSVPPYSGTDCTSWSPGRRNARNTALIADMPLEVTAASSEPSSSDRRSSTISRLGWLKRLYTSPADSPCGSGLRPDTRSKNSAPSSAERKAKVEVRNTGGLTAPSDRKGSKPYDIICVSACSGRPEMSFL